MNRFSNYLKTISRVNNLENGSKVQWLFHCGMLFSSMDKWWGDFKFRNCAHEGIDVTYFRTDPGEIQCFGPSVKIPAMDDGKILNICDDYLGQTLVVEHHHSMHFNRRIIWVYAHITPEKGLRQTDSIQKDDIIARVCDTHKNPQLPPHLHFSCFEVDPLVQHHHLTWDLFSKKDDVNLIHPLFV